jgi:alkylation response protein AidB-like acyl-CoA dehydrogenase
MNIHGLTDEQREIRALTARFADEVVAPQASAWDKEHRFPKEVIAQLGELGLMGVCIAQDLGGAGADFLTYTLVLEELSRGDAGLGVTIAVHTGAGTLPIIARGTRRQIERLVPPLAQGHELAAFALTESNAGSDASALLTRCENGCLTGTKQWVTNGSHAHVFIVFAKDPDRPSAFVVRRGGHGVKPVRGVE